MHPFYTVDDWRATENYGYAWQTVTLRASLVVPVFNTTY